MVPREVRRDVVEEIKWRPARQYYARVGYVKRAEISLVSRCNRDFVFRRNGRVHLNRPRGVGDVSSVDYWQPRCAHQLY